MNKLNVTPLLTRGLLQLTSHPTTVDGEYMPIQIITRGGRKKYGGAGEIFRRSPASGRNAFEYLSIPCFVRTKSISILRRNITRCDRVYVDIIFRPFVRKGFR